MARHVVGTVAEIPPGGRKLVQIEGRSIGVFNLEGEFFALRNRCAHQGGPLCQGRLTGFLQSRAPGDYTLTRQGEILRCPWHGWEFDVRTGQSWWDPGRTRARRYEVEVVTGQEVAGEEMAGPRKGPYVVETYPVSVEEKYVVVELP